MSGEIDFSSSILPQSVWEMLHTGDVEGAKAELTTYLDTLQEDDRKAAVNFFVHIAGVPTLVAPKYLEFINGIEAKESELISDMLDKWTQSIDEQAKRIREKLGSPQFQQWLYEQSDAYQAKVERDTPIEMRNAVLSTAEYQNWYQSLTQPQRAEEKIWNVQQSMRTQLSEGVTDFYKQSESAIAGTVAIAAFMIAGALVGTAPGMVNIEAINVLTPVQEATGQLASLVPLELQGGLFLGVNLFALGAIYYSHAQNITEAQGKPKPDNPNYVRAFAANMMNQINGPEVKKLIGSLLSHQPGLGNISKENLQLLTVVAQLSMLSVAMAALYKSQTGWISGMDYAGMVTNGKPENDEERVLQREIQGLLKQLPPDARAKALEGIMAYMDSNPSIKDLMKPSRAYSHAFAEVFNTNIPG